LYRIVVARINDRRHEQQREPDRWDVSISRECFKLYLGRPSFMCINQQPELPLDSLPDRKEPRQTGERRLNSVWSHGVGRDGA